MLDLSLNKLMVEDGMELVLWLAIAQRNALLHQGAAFEELVSIRGSITAQAHAQTKDLAPEEADEIRECLADWVFDRVDGLDFLVRILAAGELALQYIDRAETEFGNRIATLRSTLSVSQGFRLADFSHRNNLLDLLAWWTAVLHSTRSTGSIATIQQTGAAEYRALICPSRIPLLPNWHPPKVSANWQQSAAAASELWALLLEQSTSKDGVIEVSPEIEASLQNTNGELRTATKLAYQQRKQQHERYRKASVSSWLIALTSWDRWQAGGSLESVIEGVLSEVESRLEHTYAASDTSTIRKHVVRWDALIRSYHPSNLPWSPSGSAT